MGRHTTSVCKLCRREGKKLLLKGHRCTTAKCALDKRAYAPGMHGKVPRKLTEYAFRLREKQKARRFYGISERQFRRYFELATKSKTVTGTRLLQILETRMDNIIYRIGLAESRPQARQMVKHGHFTVNKKKVSIPSYNLKAGDVIEIKTQSQKIWEAFAPKVEEKRWPGWLNIDVPEKQIKLSALPTRGEMDVPVEEHLIVEFYSR
jgi:small subunit ribosomal protein S4